MKPLRIYSLPRSLSEEELATVMAKCARSPEPFDEIAEKVTVEGASQFHEKYVIGYGHGSVAEIAVPNFCFEGVSILASKILESMQRGAYQEKSTRAQNFLFRDENSRYTAFYIPSHLEGENRRYYIEAMEHLFAAYEEMTAPMQRFIKEKLGKDDFAAKRRAFDSLRYLLPIGTQTNLGMRINGLDTARLITKLLSSEYIEFREIGRALRQKATEQLPTLVRHAGASDFLSFQEARAAKASEGLVAHPSANRAELNGRVMTNEDAVRLVADAFVTHHGCMPLGRDTGYDFRSAEQLIDEIMDRRGDHDPIPEEFSAVPTVWDIVVDYGAYRDLQRHRRLRQFPQKPSTDLGYETPDDIVEAGLGDQYRATMEYAADAVESMRKIRPDASVYMIPLAYRHRTIWHSTLDQDGYVIELRSKPQGHISYRRIVAQMYEQLMSAYPGLARHFRWHALEE